MNRLKWVGHVDRMDADRILKSIFSNQPEGNCLIGRPRNCVKADLKKCKVFEGKKRSADKDGLKMSTEETKALLGL